VFISDRRRIVGEDRHNIIPRGVSHGAVIPLDLQCRITTDYDIRFMQDRIRADIFINGQPTGHYSQAVVDDRDFGYPGALLDAMERYAPDLQRAAIDEFVGYNLRRKVEAHEDRVAYLNHKTDSLGSASDEHWARLNSLETEVRALRAIVSRPRWYKRAALKLASWWV
jgi:hypothetical protein